MDQAVITNLLIALVLAIISILAYALKKGVNILEVYAIQKIGASKFESLKSQATTVVRFLEQSPAFKDLTGAEKKERAILDITNWCKEHNVPIESADIDTIIEEAVHIMNETKLDISELGAFVGEVK